MLEYKLGEADGIFLEAPTKTLKPSQRCPDCWQVKPKTLAERLHQCPCGCTEDRDVASAKVCLLWATGVGTTLDKRGLKPLLKNPQLSIVEVFSKRGRRSVRNCLSRKALAVVHVNLGLSTTSTGEQIDISWFK